jgi:alkylation response protein AidB-like acyl-CoA dehydrogenase
LDFLDTPAEARFRAEVRAWFEANAEPAQKNDLFRMASGREAEIVASAREWQKRLHDAGWAGITWPREHGGRGGTAVEQMIFNQEKARFDVPLGPFAVGMGMVGPTLIAHGSDDQKRRYLPPLLRGEEIWCQLFSEPGAGSDLANLSTRAVLDGDSWVVDGQKVWTSNAHFADLGILVARTDPDQPKHRGLTYFVCDMRDPGIDVRPLRQIGGTANFNEVFLTGVRVPNANVVGDVGGGWGVAMTTLTHERSLMGGGLAAPDFAALRQMAVDASGGDRPPAVLRQQLAETFTESQLLRYLGYRVQTAISQGRLPGAETSVMKLLFARYLRSAASVALATMGPAAVLAGDDAPQAGAWQHQFLHAPGMRIAGGTDEIQHNVIGEQVLGLPREPRTDKTVSWRESRGPAQK